MAESRSTQSLSLTDYLESQHSVLTRGEYWNCLPSAKVIARYLLAKGRRPWIARMHKTELRGNDVFYVRLTPQGLVPLRTWTTHYVCCCDDVAYEPVVGRTVPLESYVQELFGLEIELEVFVSADELPKYVAEVSDKF